MKYRLIKAAKGKTSKAKWRVLFYDDNGKFLYSKTRSNQKRLVTMWAEQQIEESLVPDHKKITALIEEYKTVRGESGGRGGRPWSEKHKGEVKRILDWWTERLNLTRVSDITLPAVLNEKNKLSYGAIAKNRYVTHLKAFVSWARKMGYTDADPFRAYVKQHETISNPYRALSEDEIRKLLSKVPFEKYLCYKLAILTGYRYRELITRRVKDLNFTTGRLVLDAEHSKNKKERIHFLPMDFVEELKTVCGKMPGDNLLPWFPEHHPARYLQFDCKLHGIPVNTDDGRLTFHSLRAVHGTLLNEYGVDPKSIQLSYGHSSLQMTSHYIKRNEEKMRYLAEILGGKIFVQNTYKKNEEAGLIQENWRNQDLNGTGGGSRTPNLLIRSHKTGKTHIDSLDIILPDIEKARENGRKFFEALRDSLELNGLDSDLYKIRTKIFELTIQLGIEEARLVLDYLIELLKKEKRA